MRLGITRFLSEKWKRQKSSMAIRWYISVADTERLSFENGNWKREIGKAACDRVGLKIETPLLLKLETSLLSDALQAGRAWCRRRRPSGRSFRRGVPRVRGRICGACRLPIFLRDDLSGF